MNANNKNFSFIARIEESLLLGKEQIVQVFFTFNEIRTVIRCNGQIEVKFKDQNYCMIPENYIEEFELWLAEQMKLDDGKEAILTALSRAGI